MTLEEMLRRVDAIDEILTPLENELVDLEIMIRKVRAAKWIEENGVTRNNVQLTAFGSPGVPYLNDIGEAKRWIVSLAVQHPFVAWNDGIYSREDFLAGRIRMDAPARLSDLQ